MHQHISAPLLALNILLWLPGAEVRAQQIPSPYVYLEKGQEAGAFVGHVAADAGRFGFGPQSGLAMGGRYGIEVSGPFGLEGAAVYFPTTRDVINPRRAEGDRKVDEAELSIVVIDARLRFGLTGRRTWHGINPFLIAGGGIAFDIAGDQAEDQKIEPTDRFDFGTAFLGVLGGGVRVALGERFFLRGDAHLTLWQLDTPEGFEDPDLEFEAVPKSEWVNNTVLAVGLSYRF